MGSRRVDAELQQLARAAREAEPEATTGPRWLPGTVISEAGMSGDVTVSVDGGPSTEMACKNATGFRLAPGARVMVLFAPPHGASVVQVISNPPIAYTPDWFTIVSLSTVDITINNGTSEGYYSVVNGQVQWVAKFGRGSTTNFNGGSGLIYTALPVHPFDTGGDYPVGQGWNWEDAYGLYPFFAYVSGPWRALAFVAFVGTWSEGPSGDWIDHTYLAATGDSMLVSGSYLAA